jgi:hypothetical protein
MSKRIRLLLALLALGQSTCNQAILTAPSNSTLDMFVNPEFISANGGVSVISVLVVEPAGTVVPDGTVVKFLANLGDIPEQGKTNDGVVRVNFRATGRSGEATITAISGGGGGGTSPTTTTTIAGSTDMPFVAAASTSVTGIVTIGNLNASRILVEADPPRITVSRSTQITATVFDNAGNPLAGAPVYFDLDPTQPGASTNFMDFGGPRFTDSNGEAFDVMRTRNIVPGTATVRARVPAGAAGTFLTGTVVVQISLN